MTVIALHAHPEVGWVSWRVSTSFGRVHLERLRSGATLCNLHVPRIGRVVRNQETAALEDICRGCLRVYSQEHRTHD